jgi:antitoxin component of RelBE/YafQ-DinJ toxin-antitoxin module
MKSKLTLTIDENLIPQAKRYAEARGDSLSGLVEKTLQDLTQTKEMPFSRRWRGKFKASRRVATRYKALARCYL